MAYVPVSDPAMSIASRSVLLVLYGQFRPRHARASSLANTSYFAASVALNERVSVIDGKRLGEVRLESSHVWDRNTKHPSGLQT